jgi:hypothetical protein
MPVILATKEAEIRRIAIQSKPKQTVHKTLSQKTLHKKGLVEWLRQKLHPYKNLLADIFTSFIHNCQNIEGGADGVAYDSVFA